MAADPPRRSRRQIVGAIKPRREDGQGLVEFALVGPIAFLLILGIIVAGIAVSNQDLLNNSVRDTARAAAVCGGSSRTAQSQLPPSGSVPTQTCSWAALNTYAQARLTQLVGGSTVSSPAGGSNCQQLGGSYALVCVYKADNTAATISGNPLDTCQRGYKIEISTVYAQPLYLPLVGNFLGSGGSTTSRALTADAEATCEQ